MGTDYIYHYCAMRQETPGQVVYNDGTVTCKTPIDSSDRFAAVREVIAAEIGIESSAFSITSLTLLNPPSAAEAASTVAIMMGG